MIKLLVMLAVAYAGIVALLYFGQRSLIFRGAHTQSQPLDRCFVKPSHRSERARDQVELILDHEVGGQQWPRKRRAVSALRSC